MNKLIITEKEIADWYAIDLADELGGDEYKRNIFMQALNYVLMLTDDDSINVSTIKYFSEQIIKRINEGS